MLPKPARYFKTSVAYFFFRRAPRKFKTPQALIFSFGPAEVQSLSASLGQIPYRFKHGEVIGAQLLQPFVRSAKFINRMAPQLKKHGGRDGDFVTYYGNNRHTTGAN